MIKYAKMKYITNCLFYDAVESGDDRLTAGKKVIGMADSYEGVDRIILIFTIIWKLMGLHIELTSDLLEQAVSAVQAFQAIPKEKLDEMIQRYDYVQDMETHSYHMVRILRLQYHMDIQNDAEEGE